MKDVREEVRHNESVGEHAEEFAVLFVPRQQQQWFSSSSRTVSVAKRRKSHGHEEVGEERRSERRE